MEPNCENDLCLKFKLATQNKLIQFFNWDHYIKLDDFEKPLQAQLNMITAIPADFVDKFLFE